jgi:3-oxoacyl-[acyl-carrier protein] reductase
LPGHAVGALDRATTGSGKGFAPTGVQVAAHAADVGNAYDAARLIEATVAAYGGIDILVNNVGGGGGARVADSSDDDWRGALEQNLIQTVRMMRLALPCMKERLGAAVINIASISGWSPQLAMSGQYGAAKAALIFDTERWALEFIPYRIRVNTVSPGSLLVDANGWDRYRLASPRFFEDYVRHGFPMGRLGTAEEVADVIVFIASPRAHWINGRNIPVDGLEQPHAPLDRRRSRLSRSGPPSLPLPASAHHHCSRREIIARAACNRDVDCRAP